ncbi:MAG: hypothetical protein ABSE82_13180 [Nitrososphaerales archaeon]
MQSGLENTDPAEQPSGKTKFREKLLECKNEGEKSATSQLESKFNRGIVVREERSRRHGEEAEVVKEAAKILGCKPKGVLHCVRLVVKYQTFESFNEELEARIKEATKGVGNALDIAETMRSWRYVVRYMIYAPRGPIESSEALGTGRRNAVSADKCFLAEQDCSGKMVQLEVCEGHMQDFLSWKKERQMLK